jgi:predicted dehydrogenase
MEYMQQNLFFKLKKGIRYIFLYGVKRTLIKIKSQYHMDAVFEKLPEVHPSPASRKHVGILGCGKFSYAVIAYYLRKNEGNVIRGVMDIDVNKAVSIFQTYKADYYTTDPNEVINDQKIDLIYIASNHFTHAEYAIHALQMGKSVHIEKPHAVTIDQLVRLEQAMKTSKGTVRLGFNRPFSVLGLKIKSFLDTQPGAGMFNWFVAGHEIEAGHWYFSTKEGGRILGNLCHWTDYLLHLVPEQQAFPITIIPTRAEKSDCDISVSYVFGEGSIGTITFSAKGHTFEGVRESLSAHKGNVLVDLKDFKSLRVDVIDKVYKKKLWVRDHGHENNIMQSYRMLNSNVKDAKQSIEYVWNSGYLALMTKHALEQNERIVIQGYARAIESISKTSAVH